MENMQHAAGGAAHGGRGAYIRLAWMAGLSFIAMYFLMYAMVDRYSSVYANINQVYMAGLMAAPMVAIELVIMGAMYRDRRLNRILVAASVALAVLFWVLIRTQAGVADRQFLRSMIPHHSGAILMCGKAELTDPELQTLCRQIIDSQKAEIELMKRMLERSK
jgi:uncharacterized protein (DUF305 family)